MDENTTYTAEVRNLIALCHILDDFETFAADLSQVLVGKYDYKYADNLKILCKIANGASIIGTRKIKEFYQNNTKVINKIKEDAYLWDFIIMLYNSNGTCITNNTNFFYQYFTNHKENIEQILSVLYKIKKLGFERLEFNESFDFTNTQYSIGTCFYNTEITYLDNIKVIPNYKNDLVKYKTEASNYKITAKFHNSSLFPNHINKSIQVNSLLFDAKRLPESMTKEAIFDKIIHLKEEQKEDCIAIQNAVDLSINVEDLYTQFNSSNTTIQALSDSIENKEELREVLASIKENLDKLQTISANYNKNISQENSPITQEMIQEEKDLYLERRNHSMYRG